MQHSSNFPIATFGKGDVSLVFASGDATCTLLADRATLAAETDYFKLAFSHGGPAPRQFVYSASMLDGMLAFLKELHLHEPLAFANMANVLSLGSRFGCALVRRRVDRWLAHQLKGNVDGVLNVFESQPVSLALLLLLIVEHKLTSTLMLLPNLIARRMVFVQTDAAADAWQHALDSLPEKDSRVLVLQRTLRRSLVRAARKSSADDAVSDGQSSGASSNNNTCDCSSESFE